MTIVLLLLHGLVGVALLGALTHQSVALEDGTVTAPAIKAVRLLAELKAQAVFATRQLVIGFVRMRESLPALAAAQPDSAADMVAAFATIVKLAEDQGVLSATKAAALVQSGGSEDDGDGAGSGAGTPRSGPETPKV